MSAHSNQNSGLNPDSKKLKSKNNIYLSQKESK